jgi:radical SAM superfamily enzyme YgiQ (UPF0313 family)
MRILLVYPEYPRSTYWSFSRALPYMGKRASMPPLGLITVAALLPESWELRLVDMNTRPLLDEDLRWADAVFTSTMVIQSRSLEEVASRSRRLGRPVVAGGPHPSAAPERVDVADHVVAGEAELVLPELVRDLEAGRARPLYRAPRAPEPSEIPPPRYDLLDLSAYASMAVQYSRGCPFRCEFCDIWKLYGRRPRVKAAGPFLAELESLYRLGWSGSVFCVDDNFIGNPRAARELLPALEAWQRERGYPFTFYTEASLDLARDEGLLRGMRGAGFDMVFVGIESPSEEALRETGKMQNLRLDPLEAVRTIQASGLEVSGGFIVGFDSDHEDIFERQRHFIEEAGIPMAMVGLLTAAPGTDLHERLRREGRLLGESEGSNTEVLETNFVTRMPADRLRRGFGGLLGRLYDPTLRHYFRRCRLLLARLPRRPRVSRRIRWAEIRALLRSLAAIPFRRYGREYLALLLWTLARRPRHFPEAVRLGIMGFHFRAVTRGALGRSPS